VPTERQVRDELLEPSVLFFQLAQGRTSATPIPVHCRCQR
jgi:hypothetical protein